MIARIRVGLLGLGEVGQRLAADLHRGGVAIGSAYDPKFAVSGSSPARALARMPFVPAATAPGEVGDADLVISAVTAAEAVPAARSVQSSLRNGALYLDLNSVSPETRGTTAAIIADAGGRYLEAAVMSAIEPHGSASPMLLGGPDAEAALSLLVELGFSGATVCSAVLGRASATKMCRSVLIKGLEALLAESLLAARHYRVERAVLDSLQDLLPLDDWPLRAGYMIARSVQHGKRRAEEMREVAQTVRGAGIEPWMSEACRARQDWAGGRPEALNQPDLERMLDAIGRHRTETPP